MLDAAALAGPPCSTDSLVEAALRVLQEVDADLKAEYTLQAARLWRSGEIQQTRPAGPAPPAPARPARDDQKVKLVAARDMPRLGKGGTLASRQALLHSLVHIESWAVDLAWDAVARFGCDPAYACLPRAFFDDFVAVAEDECRHYRLLKRRLEALGCRYGAYPGHDGLWESAAATAHSLPARLAVEHCVHEARGLDVLPQTVSRFRAGGDAETADLLQDVIYQEEISHCAAGVRWLTYLHCTALSLAGCSPSDTIASEVARASVSNRSLADGSSNNLHQQPGLDAAEHGSGGSTTHCSCSYNSNGGSSSLSQQQLPIGTDEGEAAALARKKDGAAAGGCAEAGTGCARNGSASRSREGRCAASSCWEADARRHRTVESWFHALVRAHFRGPLKPPFNAEARAQAGFGPQWYLPLAAAML